MRNIDVVKFKAQDEVKVMVPVGAGLLGAFVDEPTSEGQSKPVIAIRYIADVDAPEEDVTFYVLEDGDEVPDTFTGRFFKTVTYNWFEEDDDGQGGFGGDVTLHIFFKPIAPKKAIVVERNPNDPGQAHKRGGE